LDIQEKPIAVVSGISGPIWLTVKLKGMAGHAGSVPMPMRKDALVGASKSLLPLTKLPIKSGKSDSWNMRNNQGFSCFQKYYSGRSRIYVGFERHRSGKKKPLRKQLLDKIDEISKKHGLSYEISEDWKSEPRYCADWIKDIIRNNCEKIGLQDTPELMSGPFHDAMAISYACDYGMILSAAKMALVTIHWSILRQKIWL
jgi:allantoate deiminase/N-carbamoyl-L-amino-acid hydrolase